MKLNLLIVFGLVFLMMPEVEAQISTKEAQSLRKRLKNRKVSWEAHKQSKVDYAKKRKAQAFKHKNARYEYEFAKKKARQKFVRKYEAFPIADYRKFIQMRDKRVEKVKQRRKDFQKIRKSLNKIIKSNKFKIDKEEVYKL